MINLRVEGNELVASDPLKNEVRIEAKSLRQTSPGSGLDRETHAAVDIGTTGIVLPPGVAHLETGGTNGWDMLPTGATRSLTEQDALLQVDSSITIYLRFTADCTITNSARGRVSVVFPAPADVTVGFKSRVRRPDRVITVRRTTDDLARALGLLAGNIVTQSPDRSFPTMRGHPPRLELGEEWAAPGSLTTDTVPSGISITVPDALEYLFPVAPLAYYLGATVQLADSADPTIQLGAGFGSIDLGSLPGFERAVADLLSSTFFLDCLVRNAGPYQAELQENDLVTDVGLDIDDCYQQSIADRVATYQRLPVDAIADRLPAWHLSFAVDPTYPNARLLTYVLDRLGTVHNPRSTPYSPDQGIAWSLDRTYRSRSGTPGPERVMPASTGARLHAWASRGIPVGAFKTSLRAFENRVARDVDPAEAISIALVVNDDRMAAEARDAHAIYTATYGGSPVDYRRYRDLDVAALDELLRDRIDLLHFIGHCDAEGLRCADGWLPIEDIGRTDVLTFFLNACNSFEHGERLVEAGAIGGGVTVEDVLDTQAARVGTTFANLVVNGYNVANAIRLARTRSILPHTYIAVGDGTFQLPHSENGIPLFAEITPAPDGEFAVRMVVYPQNLPGSFATLFVDDLERSHLTGNEIDLVLDRSELRRYLEVTPLATVFDGEYYWSTELARAV